MKNTRWITGTYDESVVHEIGEALGLPSLPAKLMAVRGIRGKDADIFAQKSLSDLYDPFLLKDMKPAVEMARAAGTPVAFAGWGRKDFPKISGEMTQLCDHSFDSTQSLYKFLFD